MLIDDNDDGNDDNEDEDVGSENAPEDSAYISDEEEC